MSKLPPALLESLQVVPGFNQASFEAVHASGEQVTSIRINPAKAVAPGILSFQNNPTQIPWSSAGYYLSERPSFTFDPLFHAGTYYVQEASSMFLEQAVRQSIDLNQSLRVLDLCAAPGGKSTLLQSLINDESLLVSNEVIKSRVGVLEENLVKWGGSNTIVTNNDPIHFARLENYFDLVVVDAPCSGSGLFRRDPSAIEEWSDNNVTLCSQRQQRIIADAWPALKQDGILIYSTCSYSAAEDEEILDWICETFNAESKQLVLDENWEIIKTFSAKHRATGYRFYPDKIKGEGFFIAVLQKKDGAAFAANKSKKNKLEQITKAAALQLRPWLKDGLSLSLFMQKDAIIAIPASLENELPVLQSALYIKNAGITLGKLAGGGLVPDHSFAMSLLLSPNIPRVKLEQQQALQYLRRDEFSLDVEQKGWALINFREHDLGWIKILPGRFNNYYPKEWRIIKQLPVQ